MKCHNEILPKVSIVWAEAMGVLTENAIRAGLASLRTTMSDSEVRRG